MESKYLTATNIAVSVLEVLTKESKTTVPKKAQEILDAAEKLIKENKLFLPNGEKVTTEQVNEVKASWSVYLSKATKEGNSRLVANPYGHGYLLSEILPEKPEKPEKPKDKKEEEKLQKEEEQKNRAYTEQEKSLYPIFKDWALTICKRAKDNSIKRRGGAWSNPDIVGINIVNDPCGVDHLETLTIEVKVSDNDWQKEFFQAVAHKRFSHRAYFAYAAPVNHKPDPDMRRYAEKYNVGILCLRLADADFSQFAGKKPIDLKKYEVSDIREEWPASYEYVSMNEIVEFLEYLGIHKRDDIYSFGDELA